MTELIVEAGALIAGFTKYHRDAALAAMPTLVSMLRGLMVACMMPTAASRQSSSGVGDGYLGPQAAVAVSRALEGTAKLLPVARYAAAHLVSMYVELAATSRGRVIDNGGNVSAGIPTRVRSGLRYGVMSLMDVMRPQELQQLHAALGSAKPIARAVLKTLHAEFEAEHRYRGK